MPKFIIASLLIGMAALGAGCHEMTSQEITAAATQQLKTPVFLWAFNNDMCADRQIKFLFGEFRSYSSSGREALADKFTKTYRGVVFVQTQDLGPTTGDVTYLQLWNSSRYVINTRILRDTRKTPAGSLPGTRIDKGDARDVEGKVLTLQTTYSTDQANRAIYATYDADAFQAVRANVDANLKAWIASRKVFVNNTPTPSMPCGQLARLGDLF
jgi:hypothetical protein